MGAHEGNRYAEKWTKELALEFIIEVGQRIAQGAYHIGAAAVGALEKFTKKYPEVTCQDRNIWNYLSRKFNDDKEVSSAIKKVEILAEGKIVEDALRGEIKSAPMAIFYLKNKHGYKDKSEREVQMSGSIPIERWLESSKDDPG